MKLKILNDAGTALAQIGADDRDGEVVGEGLAVRFEIVSEQGSKLLAGAIGDSQTFFEGERWLVPGVVLRCRQTPRELLAKLTAAGVRPKEPVPGHRVDP